MSAVGTVWSRESGRRLRAIKDPSIRRTILIELLSVARGNRPLAGDNPYPAAKNNPWRRVYIAGHAIIYRPLTAEDAAKHSLARGIGVAVLVPTDDLLARIGLS